MQNTSVEVIEDLKKEEIICPDPDEIIQVYLNDYLTVSYNSIELFLSILLFIITVYSIIKALFKAKQSLSAEQI